MKIFWNLSLLMIMGSAPYYTMARLAVTTGTLIGSDKLEVLPDRARIVPDAYLVALRGQFDIAADAVRDILSQQQYGDDGYATVVRYEYQDALEGFALTNVSATTLEALLQSNYVASITPDHEYFLDSIQHGPESWGLDRIDEETLPMDGIYHYEHSGVGVDVYLLDTGIYLDHTEFTVETDVNLPRNVRCGYNAFATIQSSSSSNNNNIDNTTTEESERHPMVVDCTDESGHGTHGAAILGGTQHGVAKHANLVSVKVHDHIQGSTLSSVLAGLDYVMQETQRAPEQPAVINLSLGGPRSLLANSVVENIMMEAGLVIVVSAGNEGESSCDKSPGSSQAVIAVSATDYQDNKPFYANYGLCTDIFAPGHQITSAWVRDRRDVARLSGTSMAANHVAGVAAQYLGKYPHWSPSDVWSALKSHAMRDLVTNIPGTATQNLLLNTGDLRSPY